MTTQPGAAGALGLAPHLSCSPTSSLATLTPQARRIFQESFEKFERTVQNQSKYDQREFTNTTLRDVQEAAKEIEQQLAARQCLRNLKRLEPLLNGLETYSKVVEVLCNGTPYVPWIWAPIKLMMKLATDHIGAFEKLISAYAQIAENLPRFDRLSNAFRDNPDFQQVLAVIYSDILEFHRQAYKFFRRSGWKCFFKSSWGQFEAKFNYILDSLSRHASLIDREANAFLISETMQWRKEAREAAIKAEKERLITQLTAALTWLGVENVPHCGQSYQENYLSTLINDCCPGTTDWIMKHREMKAWLQDGRGPTTLWLKGKPGSGKSTIVARIAQSLRTYSAHRRYTLLFCFYGYKISTVHPEPVVFILATLISQILRQNVKLSTYVYEDFVAEARSPSIKDLQQIMSDLIPQLKMPRILLDGIDECIHYDTNGRPHNLTPVKDVLQTILQLENLGNGISPPKILLVSRDILQIMGKLAKKPTVSLDDETNALTAAIRSFTKQRFREIQDKFESFPDVENILNELENKIVLKSQGMFLWVRLVLTYLEEDAYNMDDLEAAVASMPVSLNEFYDRILARVTFLNSPSRERAVNILNWIICARRPLRIAELKDAIVFAIGNSTLTERSKLPATVLDLCRPLIQTHADGHVSFIHFTVQEFLLSSTFTTLREAERCVSLSCLNYLDFSLTLKRQGTIDDIRTIDVGKCLYNLQNYAHEHWFDHVLAFISMPEGVNDETFKEHLRHLCDIMQYHQANTAIDDVSFSLETFASMMVLEPRLEHIRHVECIFEALSEVVKHRHIRALHFRDTAFSDLPADPTPFSIVQEEYQKRVELLLECVSYPGLTSTQLLSFHETHRPFAFVCRFPNCSDISAGFATDKDRIQHERSHAPPLLCTHSGCKYTLGFSSLQNLKRHIREHHGIVPAKIPTSLRRHHSRSFLGHTHSTHPSNHAREGNSGSGKQQHSILESALARRYPYDELNRTSNVRNIQMPNLVWTESGETLSLVDHFASEQEKEPISACTPKTISPKDALISFTPPSENATPEPRNPDHRIVENGTSLAIASDEDAQKSMLEFVEMLQKHPNAYLFQHPDDSSYYRGQDGINKPFNFATIRRMLKNGRYIKMDDVVGDIQLMLTHVRTRFIGSETSVLKEGTDEEVEDLEEYLWMQVRLIMKKSFHPLHVQRLENHWRPFRRTYATPQAWGQTIPIVLHLIPLNHSFERKSIAIPIFPDILPIGRQTNMKTTATASNGYFDAKILSRQHAAVWATRDGKIWIRDTESSSGTFVNGARLSPENLYSDPHELRDEDLLDLGVDIVSQDQRTIVYHKIAARVQIVP